MKLAFVDRIAGQDDAPGPIATSLQFLDTLLRSPAVPWAPGQREAAEKALHAARTLMDADLLDLAREAVIYLPHGDDEPNTDASPLFAEDGGQSVDLTRAMDERRGCV